MKSWKKLFCLGPQVEDDDRVLYTYDARQQNGRMVPKGNGGRIPKERRNVLQARSAYVQPTSQSGQYNRRRLGDKYIDGELRSVMAKHLRKTHSDVSEYMDSGPPVPRRPTYTLPFNQNERWVKVTPREFQMQPYPQRGRPRTPESQYINDEILRQEQGRPRTPESQYINDEILKQPLGRQKMSGSQYINDEIVRQPLPVYSNTLFYEPPPVDRSCKPRHLGKQIRCNDHPYLELVDNNLHYLDLEMHHQPSSFTKLPRKCSISYAEIDLKKTEALNFIRRQY